MASLSTEQRRVVHRGRTFHFVSYEAEERKGPGDRPPRGPTWYLVSSNNRWPAVPYQAGQPMDEVDALCIAWLEEAVFAPLPPAPPPAPEPPQRFLHPDGGASAN
jgi:hypothetical protein